jgi:hypothetical protein
MALGAQAERQRALAFLSTVSGMIIPNEQARKSGLSVCTFMPLAAVLASAIECCKIDLALWMFGFRCGKCLSHSAPVLARAFPHDTPDPGHLRIGAVTSAKAVIPRRKGMRP